MTGLVHSVCVREGGGVPKLPLREARVRAEGIEGDKRSCLLYTSDAADE